MASAFFRSLRISSTAPSRRSFVGLSLLAGVGVPVLAGCDVISGMSKGGDVSAPSDSASAGSSAAASGSASASGGVGVGSTDWQELDAHIMGHNVAVRVSPVIRKNETTSIMALELTRAEDDASIDDVNANSYSDNGNKLGISHYLGPLHLSSRRRRRPGQASRPGGRARVERHRRRRRIPRHDPR